MTTINENILSGNFGKAVQALTLSAINWSQCASLTSHAKLKMPTSRGQVEDSRDLIRLPEMEGVGAAPIESVTNRVIASYLLCEALRRHTETNERGQTIRPFAYLKPRTPAAAIHSHFDWRSNMEAKEIGAKARLMGIKNPENVEAKAKAQADGRNAEAMEFALAEVYSATHEGLLKADDSDLIDLLLDLPVEQIAIDACTSAVDRAKQRIEAGLWADIDPEILLFLKN